MRKTVDCSIAVRLAVVCVCGCVCAGVGVGVGVMRGSGLWVRRKGK
jgi:hypothetical protein